MNSNLTENNNTGDREDRPYQDGVYSQLPEMNEVWQQTLNWQPNATEKIQFQQLYELILEGNQQLNLTRITEPIDFWEKHLWDSLRGIRESEINPIPTPQIIDIGTGAGFPGIPIAIARPSCHVTLLDSTRKKIAFLENLISKLKIENAIALTARVEAIGQQPKYRESYDLAVIRAVAAASVCAEYALPLLKVGGLAILYRGQQIEEEVKTLPKAVEKLGGAIASIDEFTTPLSNSARHCIYLRKVSPTPVEFPRGVGIPTQKPLDANYDKQKH